MRARRFLRRALGVLAALTPAAICLASLLFAFRRLDHLAVVGLVLTSLGAVIVALNLYLGLVRPLFRPRRHYVSGLPLAGTAFAMVGALLGFGSTVVAAFSLAIVLLDTGGPAAFVIATWHDASMWDA